MPSPDFLSSIERHAWDNPDDIALLWRDEAVSYGELYRMAMAMRRGLFNRFGYQRRLLCVPAMKSPATVALLVGCQLAEFAVLVPSVDLGEVVLRELAVGSGCSHLVRAADDADSIQLEPLAVRSGFWQQRGGVSHTSLLLTTSGSTGVPKVVPIGHSGFDAFASWAADAFGIGRGTRVLNYSPFNFDLCLLDLWTTLARGGCVRLVDPVRATDGRYLAGLLADDTIEVFQSVPMAFRLIAEHTDAAARFNTRELILTGDAMRPGLAAELFLRFPHARVFNVYGCTETNDSFIHEIRPPVEGSSVPIGHPLPGVDALVVDRTGHILTGAGSGELLVRTPFQTQGYLDPAKDAAKFTDDPGGSAQYFRTGDIVHRDPSGLHWLEGRDDFHVKVRGVRTNLQEVERVLLDHDEILDAAVVAIPDELAGNRLHASVHCGAGTRLNGLTVRLHCASRLPRTAIPEWFDIRQEPLPTMPNGKTDRKRIRTELLERGTSVDH